MRGLQAAAESIGVRNSMRGGKTEMIHSIFSSLAVVAIGLVAARVGDKFGTLFVAKPCVAAPKSSVVWSYDEGDYTAASSCPRSAARRVASSSPR
jgi:hypothetical protein